MEGADIMELIDELEAVVDASKSVLGSSQKKAIEGDAVYAIIDDMRANFPEELKQARWIVKERQEMLEAAEIEANRILEDAKGQALVIAGEQEVVRLAEQRAAQILEQAREMERETRFGAEDYADEIFAHLEENLGKLSASVTRCRERLNNKNTPR